MIFIEDGTKPFPDGSSVWTESLPKTKQSDMKEARPCLLQYDRHRRLGAVQQDSPQLSNDRPGYWHTKTAGVNVLMAYIHTDKLADSLSL